MKGLGDVVHCAQHLLLLLLVPSCTSGALIEIYIHAHTHTLTLTLTLTHSHSTPLSFSLQATEPQPGAAQAPQLLSCGSTICRHISEPYICLCCARPQWVDVWKYGWQQQLQHCGRQQLQHCGRQQLWGSARPGDSQRGEHLRPLSVLCVCFRV